MTTTKLSSRCVAPDMKQQLGAGGIVKTETHQ